MTQGNIFSKRAKRFCARLVQLLLLLQVVVVLLSWLFAAARPQLSVHSLLSSEGLRWLFGSLTHNLTTPLLLWLVLGSLAYGAVRESGLSEGLHPVAFRQRFALRVVVIEVLLMLLVAILLTAIPHAVLLSVTGVLFPSSFSDGLIPVVCVCVAIVGLTYGLVSSRFPNAVAAIEAATSGLVRCRWLFVLYVVGAELFASLCYVLNRAV